MKPSEAEEAGLLFEEPDVEDKEDIAGDTDDLSADDESEPTEPQTKLIPSGMPSMASSERWLECMIEEQIQKDNDAFGRKLKMYEHPDGYGRQYPIPGVGRIDLLVEDIETDDLVVIELKKGQFGAQAIDQISRYMTWVRGNLAQKGQKVSGIICVYRASQQLRDAAETKTGLEVFEYGLTLKKVI